MWALLLLPIVLLVLYFAQRLLFRRLWDENLTVQISFDRDYMFCGEEANLVETIVNNKYLPLPVLEVGFDMSRWVVFQDEENSTVSSAEQGDGTYQEVCSRTTPEGQLLKLKMNYRYDGQTQIQYSPSIYELWDGEKLLQSEQMDFQTRLYQLGELDRLLDKASFASWQVYDRFDKHLAQDSGNGMLLYECR